MNPNESHPTRCRSCRHPLAPEINQRLRGGDSPEQVAAWLGRMGERHRLSGKSIRLHRNAHLEDVRPATGPIERRTTGDLPSGDLAQLVKDIAFAKVEAGELKPTLSEGLRAQEQLDRRQERTADRDAMLVIAGLMSGAVQPVSVSAGNALLALPDGFTEAEWRELQDEKAEDEATFAALLSGEMPVLRPVESARNR